MFEGNWLYWILFWGIRERSIAFMHSKFLGFYKNVGNHVSFYTYFVWVCSVKSQSYFEICGSNGMTCWSEFFDEALFPYMFQCIPNHDQSAHIVRTPMSCSDKNMSSHCNPWKFYQRVMNHDRQYIKMIGTKKDKENPSSKKERKSFFSMKQISISISRYIKNPSQTAENEVLMLCWRYNFLYFLF